MDIEKELWGKSPCGKEIWRYTLKNSSGAYVQLSSVGAGIVAVAVPDRDGRLSDVVLGYKDPLSYFDDGPCAGKVPGRYANRIAKGHFTLDGKEYTLPVNNGPNHLHGGPQGFQNQVWESRIHEDGVEFMYYSEDGEAGYMRTEWSSCIIPKTGRWVIPEHSRLWHATSGARTTSSGLPSLLKATPLRW